MKQTEKKTEEQTKEEIIEQLDCEIGEVLDCDDEVLLSQFAYELNIQERSKMNFLETVHYNQKNGKSTCNRFFINGKRVRKTTYQDKMSLCRYKGMRENSLLTRSENKSSYILLKHYCSFD